MLRKFAVSQRVYLWCYKVRTKDDDTRQLRWFLWRDHFNEDLASSSNNESLLTLIGQLPEFHEYAARWSYSLRDYSLSLLNLAYVFRWMNHAEIQYARELMRKYYAPQRLLITSFRDNLSGISGSDFQSNSRQEI